MGISFSKQVQSSKLVDVLINLPELIDDLDPTDLRALAQVNRDLNKAIDHPMVWKVQFSKMLAVAPASLPAPGPYCPGQDNAFKFLVQGVQTARHIAISGSYPLPIDSLTMGAVHGYLHQNFPESSTRLEEVVLHLRSLYLRRNDLIGTETVKEFGAGVALAAGGSSGATACTLGALSVPAKVALPGIKMAKAISLIGVKGTKVALYSFYGAGFAASVAGAGLGVIFMAEATHLVIEDHQARQRETRNLRIQALVSERRRTKGMQ